jgi:hypothetical protein
MWAEDTWEGMGSGTGTGTILVDEYLLEVDDISFEVLMDDTEFTVELEDASYVIEIDTE